MQVVKSTTEQPHGSDPVQLVVTWDYFYQEGKQILSPYMVMWWCMFEFLLYTDWESSSILDTKNRSTPPFSFVQSVFNIGPTLESQHLLIMTTTISSEENGSSKALLGWGKLSVDKIHLCLGQKLQFVAGRAAVVGWFFSVFLGNHFPNRSPSQNSNWTADHVSDHTGHLSYIALV